MYLIVGQEKLLCYSGKLWILIPKFIKFTAILCYVVVIDSVHMNV